MPRKISVEIVGDASQLQRTFKSASSSASGFNSAMGRTGGALASVAKYGALAAGAAGLGGLFVTLRTGIGEWTQSTKLAAQTAAVLKSTGGVANVTAKEVDALANSIMNKTGIDDESIKAGENWLLTFKNVRNEAGKGNDIFNQATQAATDLAVAQANAKGTSVDLGQSSNLLGKALNDPIKGLTALTRVGVSFDAATQKAIKSLVAQGRTLEAQKIILAEVQSQVGGSAEAIGKTLPGQINILREQFNNLAGDLVGGMVPAFTKGLSAATSFIEKFSEADGAAAKFRVVGDTIKAAAVTAGEGLVRAFRAIDWGAVARTLVDGLRSAANFLIAAVRSIDWGALGALVGRTLVDVLNKLDAWIKQVDWNKAGQQLIAGIKVAIEAFARFLAGVDWKTVLAVLFQHLVTVLQGLGSLLLGIGTAIGRELLKGLQAGAAAGWAGLRAEFAKLPGQIQAAFAAASSWLVTRGTEVITGLLKGIAGGAVLLTLYMASIPAKVTAAFAGAAGWLVDAGEAVIAGFIHGITSKLGDLKDTLTGVASKVVDWKGPPEADAKLLYRSGQLTLQGFATGMEDALPEVAAVAMAAGGHVSRAMAEGLAVGTRTLPDDVSAALQKAFSAGQTKIEGARSRFSEAWAGLAQVSLQAFDANSQAVLDGLAARYKAMSDQVDAQLNATLDGLDARLAEVQTTIDAKLAGQTAALDERAARLTPAEKALARREAGRAEAGRQEALASAQQALAEAEAGGDRDKILEAKKRLKDAQYDITVAALQKQAAAERKAVDDAIAVQRAAAEAQNILLSENLNVQIQAARDAATNKAAEKKKGLDKEYADELLNAQASLAVQRAQFEQSLKELGAALEKRGGKAVDVQEKIVKALNAYGVNFEAVGNNMGVAWVKGLRDALVAAAKRSSTLGKAIGDVIDDLVVQPLRDLKDINPFGKASAVGDVGGGGGGTVVGLSSTNSNVALGRTMAAAYGWGGAQFDALFRLWQGESGWNTYAKNPSSGAYGIPQSLPGDKMASAGGDWMNNPATQIKWGLAYIAGRYGSPQAAYSAWLSRSPHWYGDGGIFMRPTVIGVGERGPEAVVPLNRYGGVQVTVNVSGVVGNTQDVARALGPAIVDHINHEQRVGRLRLAT